MPRKNTLQLDLELADEPPELPLVRRPRSRPDPRRAWRDRLRPWLLGVCAVLGIAFAVLLLYKLDHFLSAGRQFLLTPDGLAVEGVRHASRAAIDAVFRDDLNRSLYLLPPAARRAALRRIDWVREASVSRRWPNRVLVRIVEREPVAFLVLPGEHALVDADGVILKPPAARFDLPVLRGFAREHPPEVRRARTRQALEFIREVAGYAGQVSEIDAGDPENLVVTYTTGGRAVRLLLGNRNYLSRLKTFLDHQPEIARSLPGATTFDLRLDDRITAAGPPPAAPKPLSRPSPSRRGGKNVR